VATLVLLWLAWPGLVAAAGDEQFDRQDIQPDREIIETVCADLYRDIGYELLLFTDDHTDGKRLMVLTQGLGRNFSTNPIADLLLPAYTFGYQAIDFDGDRRDELLLLAIDALYLVDLDTPPDTDTITAVATFSPLFSVPEPRLMLPVELVFDLDGDDIGELLLPSWRGARLLQLRGEDYEEVTEFAIKQRSRPAFTPTHLQPRGSASFTFRLPRITVNDLNTDLIPDVYIESDGALSVFFQTGALQFQTEPDKHIDVRPAYLKNLYYSNSGFADINGDGLLDFCRVFTQGVEYDAKTLVEIFMANIQNGYPSRPTKRIVLEEFAVGMSLVDLNGNGSTSLIVATQDLSTIGMVKSLMVKRIPVELKIFGFEGGIIDEEPIAVKKVSCAVDLLGQQFPGRFLGCLTADCDRDGHNEFAVINHDNVLELFGGHGESVFTDKPVSSIGLPVAGLITAADLDGDKKDDFVIQGVDEHGQSNLIVLWPR
jgi:hypothetical protein